MPLIQALERIAADMLPLSGLIVRREYEYTPKHCSWLNQIEIWLGTLRKKLTRYGSFCSLDDLQDRILRFIEDYNRTTAKPYRWTSDGRLLCK
ncbi:transposase [Rhodopirellula sp. P2]|uniref:transposase n=1 Tax=Rhodopirellula sp. P2 TaxID=2127060 RepID=UPI0023682556|nr:transposase [Rhodopirellula sp. P2]WDQ16790.1 transposase [Rhodopirellula sp. P2]